LKEPLRFPWTSHWYEYTPAESVTAHVTLPVPVTLVESFTPGPDRWKLWIVAVSLTSKSYGPAVTSPEGPLMQQVNVVPDTDPLSVAADAEEGTEARTAKTMTRPLARITSEYAATRGVDLA
jgi:hypothetical protein